MDRILLKREDIEGILAWRDRNKELVREAPAPLKAVEIVSKVNGVRVKAFRAGRKLTLYVYHEEKSIGKIVFMFTNGLAVVLKNSTSLRRDQWESVLTIYCSLMAFMTYEQPEVIAAEDTEVKAHTPTSRKAVKRERNTYILRYKREYIPKGGHHASPKGIFTVRGHYRRYKSGKVVWINEYRKGEGDKKAKTYRLGKEANGQSEISC